jgi:hypothetical protein
MAVFYVTLGDFAVNLETQCTVSDDLSELAGVIHDYRITHETIMDLEFTQPMLNEMLNLLTGCVVGTNTDLNCYPLGLLTSVFYDVNGDPVP